MTRASAVLSACGMFWYPAVALAAAIAVAGALAGTGCGDDSTADRPDAAVVPDAAPVDGAVGPVCGNEVTEAGEACDGNDLNGYTCAGLPGGFAGGTLTCAADCSAYDVSQCTAGNGVNAAGCTQPEVQAAIDSATDGDTVNVPAGDCTWTAPITITGKSIVIIGAGMGVTNITDDTGTDWGEPLIWIDCEGRPVRISGFSFNDTGTSDPFGIVMVWGNDITFRFDRLEFQDLRNRAFYISGTRTYGVIDRCTFIKTSDHTFQGVWLEEKDGDESWTRGMSWGTGRAVVIEDSTFDFEFPNDAATDCEDGGRYVFRYNQVRNGQAGNHGLDSVLRSCLQMEIYENTFNADYGPGVYWSAVGSRGGTAVVFNNTITGTYGYPIAVTNYRSCCYAGAICQVGSNGPAFGDCDGDNPLDGNEEPVSELKGWPCKDQIGRGVMQTSVPFYEWNNTFDGQNADIYVFSGWSGCDDPHPTDHVRENRDYYNDTEKPDYVPYVYPHPFTLIE